MKRRNLLLKTACSLLVLWSAGCAAMGDIKRVAPVLGQSTWMNVSRKARISDELTATPIFNSDVDGSGYIVINASGNYQLAENISNPINITADRVSLDFKKYQMTLSSALLAGITIDPYRTEIYIHDGYVQNVSGSSLTPGINIGHSSTKIYLENLKVIGFDKGVWCAGVDALDKVTECEFYNLNMISTIAYPMRIGMALDWADANIIKNCSSLYCTRSGFELSNSQANCFYDCQSLKATGTATVVGFKSTSGTSNMFQRCVVKQTKTSSTLFGEKACGFLLTGSETKTKIIDCIVNETDVVNSVTAVTYGIDIEPTFNGGLSNLATMTIGANSVFCVAWSPDSQYLLEVDGSRAQIFKWDGINQLQAVTSVSPAALNWAKWSPDGKYIAMVDNTVGGSLRVYSFNGSSLTAAATPLVVSAGNTPMNVEWSPDGKYLAVFYLHRIGLYTFDGATLTAGAVSADFGGSVWTGCAWSPDGQYLVGVGGSKTIYVVNLAMQTVATAIVSAATTNDVYVQWSPTGKYIVASTDNGNMTVFSFNGTSLTQTCPTVSIGVANFLFALSWSPDGQYLAAASGFQGSGSNVLKLYNFTGTALTQVGAAWPVTDRVYMIDWSPDGTTIALGENTSGGFGRISLYSAMYGPTSCFVGNCRVCDTLALNQNMGRGMVASHDNVFVSCISSNNGVNYSYGIPNTYDGRFDLPPARNVVQPFDNISMPTTL